MTKSDIDTLNRLPDGWFSKDECDITIRKIDYRIRRLEEFGYLESKNEKKPPVGGTKGEMLHWLRTNKRLYKKIEVVKK